MSIINTARELAEKEVNFTNKRGQKIKARVKILRLESLSFELLSAGSSLRPSDVIPDAEVIVSGKVVYRGDLQVVGLVPLGVMAVCEARISGKWLLDSFQEDDFFEKIEDHLEEHTTQWAKDHEIRSVFRAVVADLEVYLGGLEHWCEQVECGALADRNDYLDREHQILRKLGPIVSKEIEAHFADYERVVAMLEEGARQAHREHLKATLHRFILQSPFSYRCFTKPLGYAGDYGMVQLMLGDPYQGGTLFAKLLNFSFLETGPVIAHQNRIDYLVDTLKAVAQERASAGLRTRVLNLGCGPAEEIQRLIEEDPLCELCDFELLDFNPETIRYTGEKLEQAQQETGRKVKVKFVEESIQGFLRQAARGEGYPKESYDLVYCAGLFDYLQQRFCVKLTGVMADLLREGGLVAVTNVSRENSIPGVMADFLEWTLVERTREEMMALAPRDSLGLLKELKSDSTRINLFLELRKSAALSSDVGATEETDAAKVGRTGLLGEVRSRRSDLEGSEL